MILTEADYTGGSLNPARSFGPCVATLSFRGEHWIYWAGPCLGAIVAACLFKFLKSMKYDSANPGQDLDKQELNAKILDEKLESIQRPLFDVATMVEAQQQGWDTPPKETQADFPSPSARNTMETHRPSIQSVRKVKINDASVAPDEVPLTQYPATPTPAFRTRPCSSCGGH